MKKEFYVVGLVDGEITSLFGPVDHEHAIEEERRRRRLQTKTQYEIRHKREMK